MPGHFYTTFRLFARSFLYHIYMYSFLPGHFYTTLNFLFYSVVFTQPVGSFLPNIYMYNTLWDHFYPTLNFLFCGIILGTIYQINFVYCCLSKNFAVSLRLEVTISGFVGFNHYPFQSLGVVISKLDWN